jgi:hypothetical protein
MHRMSRSNSHESVCRPGFSRKIGSLLQAGRAYLPPEGGPANKMGLWNQCSVTDWFWFKGRPGQKCARPPPEASSLRSVQPPAIQSDKARATAPKLLWWIRTRGMIPGHRISEIFEMQADFAEVGKADFSEIWLLVQVACEARAKA